MDWRQSFSNILFLFCGRRRDRIKALYWEGNGFLLLYKRLESDLFEWPRNEPEAREITPQQYRWLMEGLNVEQPKAHRQMKNINHIRVVGCWAHARRKSDEALNTIPADSQKDSPAAVGVQYCSRLFKLEERFAELTPEERYRK